MDAPNYKSSAIIFLERAAIPSQAYGPGLGEADMVQKGLLLLSCRSGFLQVH